MSVPEPDREEAVRLERALADQERILGPDHPDLATLLNDLAEAYRRLGDRIKAGLLRARATVNQGEPMGLDDEPGMIVRLQDFALACKKLGRDEEARRIDARLERIARFFENLASDCHHDRTMQDDCSRRAQSIRKILRDKSHLKYRLPEMERTLGPDHPEVASCLEQLGALHLEDGRHIDAELVLRRALQIKERALGREHLEIAWCLDQLGKVYLKAGRYADAEAVLRRALQIRETALGPDHQHVGFSLSSLARVYLRQGRDGEGAPLVKRATAIWQRAKR